VVLLSLDAYNRLLEELEDLQDAMDAVEARQARGAPRGAGAMAEMGAASNLDDWRTAG
jgi:hypothetical protein